MSTLAYELGGNWVPDMQVLEQALNMLQALRDPTRPDHTGAFLARL
jgi:hypothetical protein